MTLAAVKLIKWCADTTPTSQVLGPRTNQQSSKLKSATTDWLTCAAEETKLINITWGNEKL